MRSRSSGDWARRKTNRSSRLLRFIRGYIVRRNQVDVILISTRVEVRKKYTHSLQQRGRPLARHSSRVVIPLIDPTDEETVLSNRKLFHVVNKRCEQAIIEQVLL